MVKNKIKSHIKLVMGNIKLSLLSAMEYKFNFLMQTVGMIVNDIFWLILWWLIFEKFKNINGWVFNDMLQLYAVILIAFGIANSFFYGAARLYRTISEGRLDYYLSLPKNVLLHSILRANYSAMGDLAFGIILVPFALSLYQLPLFFYFILTGTILFISIDIIFNSLTFYFGNSERLSRVGGDVFLTFSSYPFSVFGGTIKFVLLTLFPAGLVSGIPIEVIKNFDLTWFVLTGIISILFLIVSIVLFYAGLRKYESGNLLYGKD